MTNAVSANKINLQISDLARLIFQDERPGMIGDASVTAEVVMSLGSIRLLRDMLVQLVKDEEKPYEPPLNGA